MLDAEAKPIELGGLFGFRGELVLEIDMGAVGGLMAGGVNGLTPFRIRGVLNCFSGSDGVEKPVKLGGAAVFNLIELARGRTFGSSIFDAIFVAEVKPLAETGAF